MVDTKTHSQEVQEHLSTYIAILTREDRTRGSRCPGEDIDLPGLAARIVSLLGVSEGTGKKPTADPEGPTASGYPAPPGAAQTTLDASQSSEGSPNPQGTAEQTHSRPVFGDSRAPRSSEGSQAAPKQPLPHSAFGDSRYSEDPEGTHDPSALAFLTAAAQAAGEAIEEDPAYDELGALFLRCRYYREMMGCDPGDPGYRQAYGDQFVRTLDRGIREGVLDERLAGMDIRGLAEELDPEWDGLIRYMGVSTLMERYSLRFDGGPEETIQGFWMRVAMGLALEEDRPELRAREFYQVMSRLLFIPSTPTLFHAGLTHAQLSSCYLTTLEDDLPSIFKGLGDNALLAKWSGGIGNDWTNIRGTGALIKSTRVSSQGVIPFLKIANDVTLAINRSGRRRGATCAYLETWHYDIEDFLDLRRNTGDDRRRTHDMNTANWVPDLFMQRVLDGDTWTLFSPEEVPDLHELYGQAFKERYEYYETLAEQGKIRLVRRVDAKKLWRKMLTRLFETGHPWITFKDPCNIRSPQDHIGVVHNSNLCTEITLNTSREETAVCNLGSVNLVRHLRHPDKNQHPDRPDWSNPGRHPATNTAPHSAPAATIHTNTAPHPAPAATIHTNTAPAQHPDRRGKDTPESQPSRAAEPVLGSSADPLPLDTRLLESTITTAMRILDNVIDLNYYPTPEARTANLRHRPVGLGIMGFQDLLFSLGLAFEDPKALDLSDRSMELVSYHAILASSRLARERGAYQSFAGSKWDRNLLPQDTLSLLETHRGAPLALSTSRDGYLDWEPVRHHIRRWGMRNSNCLAIAPTATISTIAGTYPCIEPAYKNLYVKSNMSGEFTVVNRYLAEDLKARGLWTEKLRRDLKYRDGSVQQIPQVPDDLRQRYKEVFEIDPLVLVEHTARRGKWIDQSQSHTVFLRGSSGMALEQVYLQAWRMGLKTTYYLRTLAASQIEKSTLDAKEYGYTQTRSSLDPAGLPKTDSHRGDTPATPYAAGPANQNSVSEESPDSPSTPDSLRTRTIFGSRAPQSCTIDNEECEVCQ
ncbi:ribonucleoside-diphosphate reductase subunit alpha [Spirochaeta lutea]|uniref:ribonucleoside-diphosphate reductase subunit alpha n=1 Tax=Spirochaeta lutea TaxID=1480694 RepID=UPI00068B35E1|nr:ribonucleoside-diphosphate reductase subunit alpha [Spirochaeta lutea]